MTQPPDKTPASPALKTQVSILESSEPLILCEWINKRLATPSEGWALVGPLVAVYCGPSGLRYVQMMSYQKS